MSRSRVRQGLLAAAVLVAVGGLSLSLVGFGRPTVGLNACFSDVAGLEVGDPVLVRGVHVGRVKAIGLDEEFRPCAELRVRADVALPDDTSAAILSLNLLGDRCVDLDPGGSSELLGDGGEVALTQGSLAIERMISRLLYQIEAD